jgi:CRP-like cAMP-binding protein
MNHSHSEFRVRLEERLMGWGLPGGLASEIEEHSTPVTYERGAIIFLRGTPADLLFWLLKGFAKLYMPHENGYRTLVALTRPGDLLGFIDSVDSKGRRQVFEAQALTKCSVGLFSRDHMVQLLRKLDHETMIRLFEHLNSAWSMMFERYVSFMGSSFRHRLEAVLTNLGTRFGINDKRGTLIVPELSHEDLAEMIGSSRPMVSKLIGDMTREGILTRGEKHHFILRNHARRSEVAFSTDTGSPRPNGDTKHNGGPAVPLSISAERENQQRVFSRP